ncbi:MAG: hypothetical protein EX260_08880 [Desulfobulbaceae bacterium]|nr:MAG: hypothetical protein EX260_08880 [Desulfobulbaceae bacterium]
MHDINTLDQLGIPGIMVATKEFKPAAAAQSNALGFDPNIIWVEHPIQNRTKDELRALAEGTFEPIMALLKDSN